MFKKDMTRDEFIKVGNDVCDELSKLAEDCKITDFDWDKGADDNGNLTLYICIEKHMYIHGTWTEDPPYWGSSPEDYERGDIYDEQMDVPSFELTDFFPSLTRLPAQVGKYKLLFADVNDKDVNEDINIDYDFDDIKNDESEYYDDEWEAGAIMYDAHVEGKGDVGADVGVWIKIIIREEDEN